MQYMNSNHNRLFFITVILLYLNSYAKVSISFE